MADRDTPLCSSSGPSMSTTIRRGNQPYIKTSKLKGLMSTEFNEDDLQMYLEGIDADSPVSPAIRQTISACLIKWKPLGRQLGLSDATIETIQHNNTNDYDEQKYQCLYHWVTHRGRDATILNLLRVIYYSLNDKGLLEDIVQALSTAKSEFNEDDLQMYLEGIDADSPVSPAIRQTISACLIKWKPLGRQLGLSNATIETIQHNNADDYDEQKYQCLYHWVKHRGRDATILNLLRVIYYRLNDKGLLEDIVQALSTAKSEFNEDDFRMNVEGLDVNIPVSSAIRPTISAYLIHWKPLGRQLGLSDATVEKIQRHNCDCDEQAYQCLYHWVKHSGGDATILSLLSVIYYRLNDKGMLEDIVQALTTAKSGDNKAEITASSKETMVKSNRTLTYAIKINDLRNHKLMIPTI